jgi:uncharacterized protein YlxW (UPF0749 family)
MEAADVKLLVEEAGLELSTLEREERELSAQRRRLHAQIDGGFSNELALTRERKVSEQRRALHERIDVLRAQVGRCWGG